MLRLGLTGGIGSGKSTVAEFFTQHRAVVIDADAISRATTASGGLAIAPIAAAFGADFITADGALDRARMRQASFSDPAARATLESIVHPLVAQESALREQNALDAGAPCIVFDVPLLVESRRWRQRVDLVLVVDCLVEVQISRVMARSGLARDEIERIISAQVSRTERLRAADIVIFNAGPSREQIADEVNQIARRFGL
ncbi:MAG: dephospho-CoA kinase [Rhodoferax sp.]|nr:dephospho-CoA kinase [Rhodoferax sp.]MBP9928174.1 dephospho-CoA kinase [Rhodoferax sp.]HQX59032.1 dephospho-CoA kinase [Burkholderiaceae bacterium]HQZ04870.1 dephospho-CoA kinase [Burkholderiaceae bacterium]HRA63259.1 dephospho-CoA kinase [Burkholderiaceae bacterium]